MAGRQQQIELFDLGPRLEEHLRRCGFDQAHVQRKLILEIIAAGRPQQIGDEERIVLSCSNVELAKRFQCSDRAVAKAAATLRLRDWFDEIKPRSRGPSIYVLDAAAVRAMTPILDRLGEAMGVPPPIEPDRTRANRSEPKRTEANRSEPPARILPELNPQNPCFSSTRLSYTGSSAGFDAVRSGSLAGSSGGESLGGQSDRRLPPYPWAREGGVSDSQLVAAMAARDVELFEHLYDHAVRLRWILASDARWHDFLVACHHAATARLSRRMGRLVAFVKQGLDVSRTRQTSDDWAAGIRRDAHRDPALVALGRSMGGEG